MSEWPKGADGDVFRQMQQAGFDFDRTYDVDFNVDFESWPPAPQAIEVLKARYGDVEIVPPDDDGAGYVLVVVRQKLTYCLVIDMQEAVTTLMQPFGGVCDSWGVMQE